jgi:hypothetical protein
MAVSATTVDVILSHFSQISVKNKTKTKILYSRCKRKKKIERIYDVIKCHFLLQ